SGSGHRRPERHQRRSCHQRGRRSMTCLSKHLQSWLEPLRNGGVAVFTAGVEGYCWCGWVSASTRTWCRLPGGILLGDSDAVDGLLGLFGNRSRDRRVAGRSLCGLLAIFGNCVVTEGLDQVYGCLILVAAAEDVVRNQHDWVG